MKYLKKIVYIILSLSFLPLLLTYFAYGNTLDMVFFGITLIFFIGLLYHAFSESRMVATAVSLLGTGLLLIQFFQLNQLWFNNEGGDLKVVIVFTMQSLLTITVLVMLIRDIIALGRKSNHNPLEPPF